MNEVPETGSYMMKSWECPECGNTNSSEMLLCVCGYLDDGLEHKETMPITDKPIVPSRSNLKTSKKFGDNKQRTQNNTDTRHNLFSNWLTFETWKHSYSRWMVVLVLGIFYFRGTTDGLWFIAFLLVTAAGQLESYKKYGRPIIVGKKKNQSIREYGIARTVIGIFFSWVLPESLPMSTKLDKQWAQGGLQLWGGALFTSFVLHLYVGVIIFLDYFDTKFTAQLLRVLNKPFMPLIDYWSGPKETVDQLILHGYANRVSIVNHIYISAAVGCIIYGLYWGRYFMKLKSIEEYFDGKLNVINKIRSSRESYIFKLNRWPPGRWLLKLGITILATFLIYKLPLVALYFPGEPHPRFGKYMWMYSYIYADNIGLFTPTYLLPMFVTIPYACLPFIIEPFYRGGLYLVRQIKNNYSN